MVRHRRVVSRLLGALVIVLSWGAASAGAAPNLFGGVWLAEDIDGRGVIDKARSTIGFETGGFETGGNVSGSGGCNRFHGAATIDGNTITFGPLAATRKMCVPALMDQEQKFFAGLADVKSYRLEGPYLFLDDAEGTPRLKFTRLE